MNDTLPKQKKPAPVLNNLNEHERRISKNFLGVLSHYTSAVRAEGKANETKRSAFNNDLILAEAERFRVAALKRQQDARMTMAHMARAFEDADWSHALSLKVSMLRAAWNAGYYAAQFGHPVEVNPYGSDEEEEGE